MILNAEGFIIT